MNRKILPLLALILTMALLAGCAAVQQSPAGSSGQNGAPNTTAPGSSPAATPPANSTAPAPPPSQPKSGDQAPAGISAKLTVPDTLVLSQGKPAVLAMELRNNVAAMTITYNSGQQYDFWVTQDDRVVWRWSDGRMFTQVVTSQTFNADGVLRFEVEWDGKDSSGKPVPPGSYMVHARWTAQTELSTTPQPGGESIKVR